MYSWGPSPEFPKQLSCIPFRFSCGGLRKGLLTFGTRVKQPFAQSAVRHPKIAQSHKSCNNAPKFQLFPGSLPRISTLFGVCPQNSDFELVKHEKVDECFNHAEQAETCRVMVWRRIGQLTRRSRSSGSESFLFLTQRKQSSRAAEFLRVRTTTKTVVAANRRRDSRLPRRLRFDAKHHRRVSASSNLRLCRLNRHKSRRGRRH